MPVIEVRTPGDDEEELAPQDIGAVSAGVAFDFPDLAKIRGSQGLRYIAALVVNGSSGAVTMRDESGRTFPVKASQTAEWDLPHGASFLSLTPEVATVAGDVTVTLRLRREA